MTQTADELIDIFGRFGFAVARGPEVEDVHHNFDALNIPVNHPARDPFDNFYLAAQPQAAGSAADGAAPLAAAVRHGFPPCDAAQPDQHGADSRDGDSRRRCGSSRSAGFIGPTRPTPPTRMFHQIEGLLIDRGVTMADLKSVLRLFAQSYLGEDVHIRFRPSFFPFTEPSVEVDMSWHGGERWVEMGGAGMVDPNVLRAVGYDPEEVTGFAFGLGVERLCMRRHRIDDIRVLYQNDVQVLAAVLNKRKLHGTIASERDCRASQCHILVRRGQQERALAGRQDHGLVTVAAAETHRHCKGQPEEPSFEEEALLPRLCDGPNPPWAPPSRRPQGKQRRERRSKHTSHGIRTPEGRPVWTG